MSNLYDEALCEKLANQIYTRWGSTIHSACTNSIVSEDEIAGFISVEAGRNYRTQEILPDAKRFEPGVFHKLCAVRDGLLRSYDEITKKDIGGLSDAAIRNLATSWGLSQIMGWHLIHDLQGTIADLRETEKNIFYTVELLILVSGPQLRAGRFDQVLRIWNTGRANGKTYHDEYIPNAQNVRRHYSRIIRLHQGAWAKGQDSVATAPSPFEFIDSANSEEPTNDPTRFLTDTSEEQTLPDASAPEPPATDPPAEVPAGDAPGDPPSAWYNVEDWKPFAFRWLKRIWGSLTGLTIPGGGGLSFAALQDAPHWYYYAAAAVVGVILLFVLGLIVSLPFIVLWLWNRREILHLKAAQFAAMADPNMKNIGLIFEKK